MSSTPLVTFALVEYPVATAWYPYVSLAIDQFHLARVKGLRFWKAGGTGAGTGFGFVPHATRFFLLMVWDGDDAWRAFARDSSALSRMRRFGARLRWVDLVPYKTHGRWDGRSPFDPVSSEGVAPNQTVAILTRATLRPWTAYQFWQQVETVSQAAASSKGCLFAIGFGEAPWIRQATLSIWESTDAYRAFAYGDPTHREVMARTKREGWYSEELFARFVVRGGLAGITGG